jgi:hypothetical protein
MSNAMRGCEWQGLLDGSPRPPSTETVSSVSTAASNDVTPRRSRRLKVAKLSPTDDAPMAFIGKCTKLRKAAGPSFLLELTPELQEHIALGLSLRDLSALAVTCRAATPLQSSVISMRIGALRMLIATAHGSLLMQISRLPSCGAREQIVNVIESSMLTFRRVCSCNEEFLRLSRAVALRGLSAPFTSPVDAARLAKSCCQTCDDITRALLAVSVWLNELLQFVEPARRDGAPQPSVPQQGLAALPPHLEQQQQQQQQQQSIPGDSSLQQLLDESLPVQVESAPELGVSNSS